MIKITFINNRSFMGEDFDEIAKKVKKEDSSLPESVNEFMENMDYRYNLAGIDLDTSSPENFFRSIEEEGFCKIEEV